MFKNNVEMELNRGKRYAKNLVHYCHRNRTTDKKNSKRTTDKI